jgi:glycine/D-amino acid oxidase-like deaminating enzyme
VDDVLILGGGVIGLSLAYELAGEGLIVIVIEWCME